MRWLLSFFILSTFAVAEEVAPALTPDQYRGLTQAQEGSVAPTPGGYVQPSGTVLGDPSEGAYLGAGQSEERGSNDSYESGPEE